MRRGAEAEEQPKSRGEARRHFVGRSRPNSRCRVPKFGFDLQIRGFREAHVFRHPTARVHKLGSGGELVKLQAKPSLRTPQAKSGLKRVGCTNSARASAFPDNRLGRQNLRTHKLPESAVATPQAKRCVSTLSVIPYATASSALMK